MGIPALEEGLMFRGISQSNLLKIAGSEGIYNYIKKLMNDIEPGTFIENAA